MIVVPTIPHTGSRFVLNMLAVLGWPQVGWHVSAPMLERGAVSFVHLLPQHKPRIWALVTRHPMVIPLRHPKVTAKSWTDRNKSLGLLVEMWEFLVYEVDPWTPHYLPLDVDDRQKHLDVLNKDMGLSLTTDWTPVEESHGNAGKRHQDVAGAPIIDALCQRIAPFLQRFY